jgi:uncharacterized protein YcbK (DUF882 family)
MSSWPRTSSLSSLGVTALLLASGAALADPPGRPAASKPAAAAAARHAPPSAYKSSVQRWHSVEPGESAPLDGAGRPELVIEALNTGERVALAATCDTGGFPASELDRAAFVLREPSSGNAHPLEPRLLDLVYRVEKHFHAPEVRVISGYRTPRGKNASNHGRGRAMDLIVPGARDVDVAAFARDLGFVGVGIYPTSGFVHLDVRDRSYFWIDASSPGRKNRERGILRDVALHSDAAARARGERGISPFAIATDVDAQLRAHLPQAPSAPDAADDDGVEDRSGDGNDD